MFNKKDYILDYRENKLIITNNEFGVTKKITGTHLHSIYNYANLDKNLYSSPFQSMVTRVLGISLPIFDDVYVKAGVKYEELVIPLIEKYFPGGKITQIKAEDVNFDYFSDVETFGGVPDILVEYKGEKIVIDVKTKKSANNNSQVKVSDTYIYQVNLYKKLLGYDKAMLLYLFLDFPDDYLKAIKDIEIHTIENSLKDVTKDSETIIHWMTVAKNNLDYCLEKKEIIGFDLRNNYSLLQILEAENENERRERMRRLALTMKRSWTE